MNNNNNNNASNHYHGFNGSLSTSLPNSESGAVAPSVFPSNGLAPMMTSVNYPINNRPMSSTGQPSISVDFESNNSNPNNISPQQVQQRRRVIQHLALLLHAHKCLQREQASNTNGSQTVLTSSCTVPNCETMRTVLQHMTKCSDFKNCSFNYCVQSRHIILHWKHCNSPTCALCGTLKRPSGPRVNNPGNREWQKRLDPDRRTALVNRIATSLLETLKHDARTLSQERSAAIQNHARKLEVEMFNTATSYEDYFQRLAEHIYKMCKDLEEKQAALKNSTLSTSMSSIDKSAGDQGPPNRTVTSSDELPDGTIKTEPAECRVESNTMKTEISTAQNAVNNKSALQMNSKTNGQSHSESNGTNRENIMTKLEPKSPKCQANNDVEIPFQTKVKPEKLSPKDAQNSQITNESGTSSTISANNNNNNNAATTTPQSTPIDAASKTLPKHPAQFLPEDIRLKLYPILERLYNHDDGGWFRQPVTEAIAPGYFDIIKNPMDFSTIMKKFNENQYTTPYQCCEDIWLVFKNTWIFNKKTHRVYKAAAKLADIFMESVDPIMKDYGYCCGRYYVFLPSAMFCYGVNGICCTIARDADYYVYQNPDQSQSNLSGDKYTFCKKCFDSVKSECISVGDDPAQPLVEVFKSKFLPAKNDHQEQESVVDCIVCSRRFHTICVLYHEHIWPEGYVCQTCVKDYNIKRRENRYLAHKLTNTDLANALEQRVNDFLRRDCHPDTGRVTIRVLAASDRICDIKPRLKRYFGSQIPDGYPYRTKAIFAFQEIQGVDVVLFGMHVQEYDSRCPGPNARRVYISYLDSVHYFRPKEKRTAVYFEILIGYLEYMKKLGYIYAHIWACPPSEGDDYIFYCHPAEQRVPKPKRLQEWYKTMLDKALREGVVLDYKDVLKDFIDNGITKASDIPYFEGDFWSSTIEDMIKELDIEEEDRRKYEELEAKAPDDICYEDSIEPEEPNETSDKRKSGSVQTYKKKNFKKTTSNRRAAARKNMTNGSDLMSKIATMMEKHKESFFVVRLRNSMATAGTIADTDPLIQCDLMESRDAFLNFAREKHCEFSSLRRAKYSTMASLIELHSSTADKLSYTCNACRNPCDIRYHCTVCEDYDLCSKCHAAGKHPHPVKRTDDSQEASNNSETTVNIQQQRQLAMQRMVEAITHAVQCRNANCLRKHCNQCKMILKHSAECTKPNRQQCNVCNKLYRPIWFHAKTCVDSTCPLPYCDMFKKKLQRQRAATMQLDRRRIDAMHRANTMSNTSPKNVQTTETNPTLQYQYSVESSSPNPAGKMMPAGGKNGVPPSMPPMVRATLPQTMSLQSPMNNPPHYYNSGKANPQNSSTVYTLQTGQQVLPPQTSVNQQWYQQPAPQQAIRYPTHGGKPISYPAPGPPGPPTPNPGHLPPRMGYPSESYPVRQQMPTNAYPYQNPSVPPGYGHAQIVDSNSNIASRMVTPMASQQPVNARFPQSAYYQPQNNMPPYQPVSGGVPPHRTHSQTNMTLPYGMSSTSTSSNVPISKSNSIDSIDLKTSETFDDPSKQHMFHPILQSHLRPSSSNFYPNMQQSPNNQYYQNQRPMTPTNDYNMNVARGSPIRPPSIPPNVYGNLANQQRMRAPLNTSTNDPTAATMNQTMMGMPSTSPLPPSTPR